MPVSASPLPERENAPAVPQARTLSDARAQDPAALRSIYQEHAVAITRRLAHMTGDAELARDITQDAFVTAFDRLHRFRGDSSLATWLHAIAYNHLRDRRKRKRRELSVWRRLRSPEAESNAPDKALQARESLQRLQAIVATLDERKRDAFVLRVVEQLSLQECAVILGARVATISYRARTAEAEVREAFERGATS